MRRGRTRSVAAFQQPKPLSKVQLKAKSFARSYVRHKLNGRKAALENYNTTDPHVASSIATENLTKPVFITAIQEELAAAGLTKAKAMQILDRNLSQEGHLPSSNAALDMLFKLTGSYAAERKLNLSLTLPGDLDEAIGLLLEDYRRLKAENPNPNGASPAGGA